MRALIGLHYLTLIPNKQVIIKAAEAKVVIILTEPDSVVVVASTRSQDVFRDVIPLEIQVTHSSDSVLMPPLEHVALHEAKSTRFKQQAKQDSDVPALKAAVKPASQAEPARAFSPASARHKAKLSRDDSRSAPV